MDELMSVSKKKQNEIKNIEQHIYKTKMLMQGEATLAFY